MNRRNSGMGKVRGASLRGGNLRGVVRGFSASKAIEYSKTS